MNNRHSLWKLMTLARACLISSSAMALSSSVFALNFPTTHYVAGIAVGDINNDGIDDIVTCGTADNHNSINVLLGKGDGSFRPPQASAVGPGPGAIALGDFNLDGILDIATANFGLDEDSSDTISVLLGYGDGRFQNRHDYGVGGTPNSIATKDLNGDGFLDFVVGESSKFVVLLGSARGFVLSNTVELPDLTASISLGDADGDGKTDVFAGNSDTGGAISRGNGDGTFQPLLQRLDNPALHPVVIDLNGDGFEDLVSLVNRPANVWYVALNNGNGEFDPTYGIVFGSTVSDFVPGDFDNDGKTDFAITTINASGEGGSLSVFLGNGDGTFHLTTPSNVSIGKVIAAGFFNSDSNLDLASDGGLSFSIHAVYGRGNGNFARRPPVF